MTRSTGSGRMDAMPRPMVAGCFSQTVAEDDNARQKSAAAYIYRQLRDADEANLLSEEDMHVYGERPMTDPLKLVRCNTCKKPVKDSQFAAHAELCRSLKLTEQTGLELNGNTRNRKPPRNDKKRLSASSAVGKRRKSEALDNTDTVVSQSHLNSQIRGTSFSNDVKVGKRRKSEALDNTDTVVSQSHLNSQIRGTSFSNDVKDVAPTSLLDDTGVSHGNRVLQASVMYPPAKHHKLTTGTRTAVIDEHGTESGVSKAANLTNGTTNAAPASMLDDTGVNSGNRVLQASVIYPPTKRHKLMPSTHIAVIEEHGTESGVSKAVSLVNGTTRKDTTEEIVSEHGDPFHKNVQQVHMQHQHMMNNDFPAPLATKIYYSQRTNRLRAAIRHMYFENLSEEVCADVECPKTSHGEMVALQGSSQVDPSFEQIDNMVNNESHSGMMHTKSSDDILAKSSEVCLLKAGGVPSDGLPNQFFLDNVSRSAATHVGLTRGSFLPKNYSFPSNTGNRLETLQQPNGSVPVI
ncbi:uncharacterized protein LOC131595526 isoform X1 [Vicia villosa]|uniref:uncharacterized protein LOC131595526 isoform X1 n=1 Tax=Vicia villosa TaxID=3911 RepID=UPI00273C0EFB|nr:uncharacterized protein LOC131595526 isoform X1 [Vicia villosa]